jgi:hypothetical protein
MEVQLPSSINARAVFLPVDSFSPSAGTQRDSGPAKTFQRIRF